MPRFVINCRPLRSTIRVHRHMRQSPQPRVPVPRPAKLQSASFVVLPTKAYIYSMLICSLSSFSKRNREAARFVRYANRNNLRRLDRKPFFFKIDSAAFGLFTIRRRIPKSVVSAIERADVNFVVGQRLRNFRKPALLFSTNTDICFTFILPASYSFLYKHHYKTAQMPLAILIMLHKRGANVTHACWYILLNVAQTRRRHGAAFAAGGAVPDSGFFQAQRHSLCVYYTIPI